MVLREYQDEFISKIRGSLKRGNKRVVCCASVGSGKTVMFSFIAKSLIEKKFKCLIITDREELLNQSSETLKQFNLWPIPIKPGFKTGLKGSLYVGMAQTLNRRVSKPEYIDFIDGIDLIIIDEGHVQISDKLHQYFNSKATVLCFTATPMRVGNQTCLSSLYTDLVIGPQPVNLIELGYLSKIKTFSTPVDLMGIATRGGEFDANQMGKRFTNKPLFSSLLREWKEKAINRKTIIFCSTIDNAQSLGEYLLNEGYRVGVVDSKNTTKSNRVRYIREISSGKIQFLVNVGIFTTGFDCPPIDCVIFFRATKSKVLFFQGIGRGIRKAEGKEDCILLDFGGNVHRHGLIDMEISWQLKKPEKKKEGVYPVKECPSCELLIHASVPKCPECGYVFPKKEVVEVDVKLEQVSKKLFKMDGNLSKISKIKRVI